MCASDITVSICCLTYNHERYIGQALDGFLAQKTDFRFEIIIHDDLSTDGTRKLIRDYAERYPELIKPIFSQTKQFTKGLAHVQSLTFDQAKGVYIAICEGDDYWVDPLKLQKQVDFMRSHPEYSLVHTDNYTWKEERQHMSEYSAPDKPHYHGDIYELLMQRNRICAPTTLFRADWAKEGLSCFLDESIRQQWQTVDLPLWLELSHRGPVGYLTDRTTVYRLSASSISHNRDNARLLGFYRSMHDILGFMLREHSISEELQRRYLGLSYLRTYKICVKNRMPERAEYRRLVREYADAIPGQRRIKLAASMPCLESLLI